MLLGLKNTPDAVDGSSGSGGSSPTPPAGAQHGGQGGAGGSPGRPWDLLVAPEVSPGEKSVPIVNELTRRASCEAQEGLDGPRLTG